MGNEESKTWVFENILFLDPNAPPFISQEEYERRLAERSSKANQAFNPYGELEGRKAVKRTTPAQTKLRTRSFRVLVDISGRRSEFLLKCMNDPLAFVLCDRTGRELRSLPAGYLRHIERKKDVVTCRFSTGTDKRSSLGKTEQQRLEEEDTILISFTFFDSSDTQGFVDTVRLLYGISVTEYGVTKTRRDDKGPTTSKSKARPPCAIHGAVPCYCGTVQKEQRGQHKEVSADTSAVLSKELPVTIVGKLETGVIIKWTDVSVLAKAHPPKAVEWRVSYIPGREPEFSVAQEDQEDETSQWNAVYDDTLLLTSDMTGKYVQVKVTRRVKDVSKRLPVVYSVAMKGPITINDKEARDVLQIVTDPNYSTQVEVDPDALLWFFPDCAQRIEELAQQQPFLSVTFGVTREGISISVPTIGEEFPVILPWNTFYVTRLSAASSTLGNEEDLYLQIHVKKSSKRQLIFRFATPSERDRNALYNAIYFFKLQKNFKNFDRWAVDLAQGNFAIFKQRYAKLWGVTNFYEDIVDTLELYPLFVERSRKERNSLHDNPEQRNRERQDIFIPLNQDAYAYPTDSQHLSPSTPGGTHLRPDTSRYTASSYSSPTHTDHNSQRSYLPNDASDTDDDNDGTNF